MKRNNRLYRDVHIPAVNELLTPIIINYRSQQQVESETTTIESRFEYTVVFPGPEEINSTNGGHVSQEAFQREVIDLLDTSNSVTFVSHPKQY